MGYQRTIFTIDPMHSLRRSYPSTDGFNNAVSTGASPVVGSLAGDSAVGYLKIIEDKSLDANLIPM